MTSFPLTGQPAPNGDAADRPIVAVPVQTGTGLPAAVGVNDADLVVVAFPSPARQRAIALYQSRDSTAVGPVADTRPLDGKLLHPLGCVLEYAGGTFGFVNQVQAAQLPQWSSLVHPSSFRLDPATGSLLGSTADARAASGVQPARPGLLPFAGTAGAGAPAPPAPVRVLVGGQNPVTLTWDAVASTWRGTLGGLALSAVNVLIQQVKYDPLVIPKTGNQTEGNPDPNGSGAATLLTGGRVDVGSWNRPGGGTSTKYVQGDGLSARLTPGITWVLLVPTGTPVLTS